MDENPSYNPSSSSRPDIDANWKKMEQMLDKEIPAAGNGNNNRRWMLAILLVMIGGGIIWYQYGNKNTEKNLNNTGLKNDIEKNHTSENKAGIKDNDKNIFSQDSSVSKNVSVENKNILHDTANMNVGKVNIGEDLKASRKNVLADHNKQFTEQKNVVSLKRYHKKNNMPLNSFNITIANDHQKNSNITQDIFKDHLPGIDRVKANINVDMTLANTQNDSANNNPAKAGKDAPLQSTAVDSFETQKAIVSNNFTTNDSATNKVNGSPVATNKTKESKKKNKSFSLQPLFSMGISPSLSLQHNGYASSNGLNYLAAADIFIGAGTPLSKRFTIHAEFHPFAGVPLRSDKWKQSLKGLDETHVQVDPNHTVTTFTTNTFLGLTSLNLPVTLHYSLTPKFNVYAGFQLSTFLYSGTLKHSFITDSSSSGVHTSSTSASANIFKTSNSNAIQKTSVNGVWGIDYTFTRFTLGLKYINGFSDITDNSILQNDQKNTVNDFKLSIKVNLAKRKK